MARPALQAGQAGRGYYGWKIVGALGFTEMTSWGIVYYAFSVLLLPMQQELGWSQSQLTGAFSLALLVAGVAALPIGRLLDRFGARGIMTLGSAAATVLVLGWSQVRSLPMLYLIWVGLGLTMAAILYEPAFVVVATWFQQQRQRALTLLTVGGGLASVVYIPLTTTLLERYGWRTTLVILAGLLGALTIPLHALVLRRRPQDYGLLPDGAPLNVESPSQTAPPGMAMRDAVRGRTFWWLAAALGLSTMISLAIGVHLFAFLTERGYPAGTRALAAALLGGSQIPSRILITLLGRGVAQRWIVAGLCGVQALALLVLVLVPSTLGVISFAVLFGTGSGALTPTRAALIAEVYGAAQYGSISGALALITTGARALAPVSAGMLVTAAHSYTPLLWILGVAALLSAAATLIAVPRPSAEDRSYDAGS